MSKAEELAEELIQIIDGPAFHVPHYKVRDVVDELRRLAALEKAIMDAEPVMVYHGKCVIDCGEHGHQNVEMLKMISAGSPLYTLNGIKKP